MAKVLSEILVCRSFEQVLDGPAYYPLHHRFGRLKAGGKWQSPVRSFAVTSDSRKSEAFRV